MASAARLVLVAMSALPLNTSGAAERVSIAAQGFTLAGELFKPLGAGPFPAVLALHGCGGLYDRDGSLNPRHADWAERLVREGFAVLLPDSFGSRGIGSQCSLRNRQVRAGRERVTDALVAKAYLERRSDIKPGSV